MKLNYSFIFLLLPVFHISCAPESDQTEVLQAYPNAHLLIDAETLNSQLPDEKILLIDARAGLKDTLIPGAVHFAAVSELGDPDHSVSNYLVGPKKFQEKMKSLGLNQNDKVLIYDEGNNLAASRLFYALEYYGFTNASLLDGGLAAWQDKAFSVSDKPEISETGDFTAEIQPSKFCDYETIVKASEDPDKIVFDVRSEGEYSGDVKRAEKIGHIPNAVNLEWDQVIESEGIPYFLPANKIQELYASPGISRDKEIIPHCQTNVRGAHAYFTLRLMGYESVRPYEGSWAEYGNRVNSPVE